MFSITSRTVVLGAAIVAVTPLSADSKKSVEDQRIELLRGLTAEFATIKGELPRSKKPLEFNSDGTWDKEKWEQAGREFGPAGKKGDTIQITKLTIEKDAIVLELNYGLNGRSHWYDKVQVSNGGPSRPISNGPEQAPGGTTIALRFSGGIAGVRSADVKKMLAPVLDFEKHSVTEQATDELPPEIKKAVQEKKAIEGMNRDQVLLAMGHPNRKVRETVDGVEMEDWIYGEPPGRIIFVTFAGQKVTKVRDTYAGLGGSIAETPK